MVNKTCPECGNPLQGNERVCSECGFPVSNEPSANFHFSQNVSRQYIEDEGDNEAEEILRKYLNLFKKILCILSIAGAIIMLLYSIIVATQVSGDIAVPMIIGTLIFAPLGAFLGIAFAKLIWAVGMIFINISTNVRKIKQFMQINH